MMEGFVVVRNSTRRLSASKVVAVVIGVAAAIGLAVAAPVHTALPTSVAERLVTTRTQHGPEVRGRDAPGPGRHVVSHRER